jgi:Bacterial transcriptional regulator/Substrate binding domain of ABC-type glycine betaine transport system
VTLGTKNFTEEYILGELYAQALQAEGFTVNLKQGIGPTEVIDPGLLNHSIDLYPEYTGEIVSTLTNIALAAVLKAGLERRTPATITDPEALRAELDRIRQRGWACTVEELETGLNTVAAPVRGADGSVVAGLSASGPSYRLGTESFPELAKKLQAGADEISSQLGYYRSQKAPDDG